MQEQQVCLPQSLLSRSQYNPCCPGGVYTEGQGLGSFHICLLHSSQNRPGLLGRGPCRPELHPTFDHPVLSAKLCRRGGVWWRQKPPPSPFSLPVSA